MSDILSVKMVALRYLIDKNGLSSPDVIAMCKDMRESGYNDEVDCVIYEFESELFNGSNDFT